MRFFPKDSSSWLGITVLTTLVNLKYILAFH